MSTRPFDLHLHVDRHGTALRQLAADLLGDGAAADDAVQETWLRALRSPPRHEASVGGWLVTLLRNVAGSERRRQRRRARHEAAAALPVNAQVEDHARALMREEQVYRLVAAVTALDVPFREAVWQRYFEGLAPREMAARSGVPVDTVKSRLKRGLQQLRERLDATGDADWRAGLAAMFGVTGSVVLVGGGALAMATAKVAAAIAVVALAGLWCWSVVAGPSPTPNATAAPTPVANVIAAVPTVTDAPVAAQTMVATPGPEAGALRVPADPLPPDAVLRGRCVDSSGNALAGCTVRLQGRSGDEDRMASWLASHGAPPAWQDPAAQTTAGDGRFAFAFAQPPPLSFDLEIAAPGRVTMSGNWERLAPGTEVDAGDIVVRTGITLTGRVVDEQGQPVAGLRASWQSWLFTGNAGPMRASSSAEATSDAAGRFAVAKVLPPGQYFVTFGSWDWELVRPSPPELTPEPAAQDVTLVVKPTPGMVAIIGKLVDDANEPVEGAWIRTAGREFTVSGREGRFELRQRRDLVRGDVRLDVRSPAHEPLRVEQAIAWGTHGLVLRLQRGARLQVRLTDVAGAAVTSFAVRLVQLGVANGSSEGGRVRVRGPFAEGVATIASVPIGKWLVWLELPEGSAIPTVTAPVEILDHSPRRIELRLLSESGRRLRVVDRAGRPVVGTKVRVADPVDGPVEPDTQVAALQLFAGMSTRSKAVLAWDGVTDGGGAAQLHGPADRPVTVLIDGPGHLPAVHADVSLADPTELVLTVDQGSSVTGRITPPEAISELRRLAGLPPDGPIPAERAATWACVQVPVTQVPVAGKPPLLFPLDADGSFRGQSVPPGSWVAYVGTGLTSLSAGRIEVREGETAEVVLDLTALLPGTLVGEVTWNGVPQANAAVQLQCQSPSAFRDGAEFSNAEVKTDAQGRFEYRGRPGSYQLTVRQPGRTPRWLRAAANAVVVRDQTTRHAFAIETGHLVVTLLEADGRPALEHQMIAEQGRSPIGLVSDGPGPFTGDIAPGEYELFVLPPDWWRGAQVAGEHPEAMARRLRVKVGAATVLHGQTTTLELRLPATGR